MRRRPGLALGPTEYVRVRDTLSGELSAAEKLAVFQLLRKRDVTELLSQSTAQLSFTPWDVNLSIERGSPAV